MTIHYLSAYSADYPALDRVGFPSLDAALAWVEAHIIGNRQGSAAALPWQADVIHGQLDFLRLDIARLSDDWRERHFDWLAPVTILHIECAARRSASIGEEIAEGNRPRTTPMQPDEAAAILAALPPLPSLDEIEDALISRISADDDNAWCRAYNLIHAFDPARADRAAQLNPRRLIHA